MHIINNQINYVPLARTDGKIRYYTSPLGDKLPSVTTILDATSDKAYLQVWKNRIGEQKAIQISKDAAGVGTAMHKSLEKYLKFEDRKPTGNLVHRIGYDMANVIIDNSLKLKFNELWGNEVNLYHSKLYAGTTDCVGIYNNKESIVDFKQSNKNKKREWIEDYCYQVVAYAEAHNETHHTKINSGVILVCTRALDFQEFVIEGLEYDKYKTLWYKRLEQYYLNHHSWDEDNINTEQ